MNDANAMRQGCAMCGTFSLPWLPLTSSLCHAQVDCGNDLDTGILVGMWRLSSPALSPNGRRLDPIMLDCQDHPSQLLDIPLPPK